MTAPVDPPNGSAGNELVGVDEHQSAGVQLNRPPAGRVDVDATEIDGLARQFTEILLYRWSDVLEWLDRNTIQRTDDPRRQR